MIYKEKISYVGLYCHSGKPKARLPAGRQVQNPTNKMTLGKPE